MGTSLRGGSIAGEAERDGMTVACREGDGHGSDDGSGDSDEDVRLLRMRIPQSEQSVPTAHWLDVAPRLPSSHSPLPLCSHASLHIS